MPDAARLLAPLRAACDDPISRILREASLDDEPLTPEDFAAIDCACQFSVKLTENRSTR